MKFLFLIFLAPITLFASEDLNKKVPEDAVEPKAVKELPKKTIASKVAPDSSYELRKNQIWMVNFINLETSTTDFDNDADQDVTYDSGDGYAFEIGLKRFYSNSANFKFGLYYRNQSIVEKEIDDGGLLQFSSRVNRSGNVTDAGIYVSVGNQWQWEHFTLGVDWIGLSQSLATWELKNKGDEDNISYSDAVRASNLRLFHISLGASF